jgi:hypothetical protein
MERKWKMAVGLVYIKGMVILPCPVYQWCGFPIVHFLNQKSFYLQMIYSIRVDFSRFACMARYLEYYFLKPTDKR